MTESTVTAGVNHPDRAWRAVLRYQRGIDALTERVGNIAPYLVIIVVTVGFSNVVLRYLGRFLEVKLVSNYWIEAQWYLFALVFLLSFPYILKHQINVRVDFWWAELPLKKKVWIDFGGHLIALIPFTLIALWVTWGWVGSSFVAREGSLTTWQIWTIWELSPDPSGLPRAPIKAMLSVGFFLLLLQALAEMVKLWAVLRDHEEWVDLPVKHEEHQRVE